MAGIIHTRGVQFHLHRVAVRGASIRDGARSEPRTTTTDVATDRYVAESAPLARRGRANADATTLALTAVAACAALAIGHDLPTEAAMGAPLLLGRWIAHPIDAIADRLAQRYLRRAESSNVKVRERALWMLRFFNRPEVRARLYAGLNDPYASVRVAVIRQLAGAYDLHALPALQACLDTEPDHRLAQMLSDVSHSMWQGKQKLTTEQVESGLASPAGAVRAAAVAGARYESLSFAQVRQLLTADTDAKVRLAALAKAAEFPPHEVARLTISALSDEDPHIRRNALRQARSVLNLLLSVKGAPAPQAQSVLDAVRARVASGAETFELRWKAAAVLRFHGIISDTALKDLAIQILRSSGKIPSDTRAEAAEAFARLATLGDSDLLRTLARDPVYGVREAVFKVLARVPSPETIAILIEAAEQEPIGTIKDLAVRALAALAPELLKQRQDRASEERQARRNAEQREKADQAFRDAFSPHHPISASYLVQQDDSAYSGLRFEVLGDSKRLAALRGLAALNDAGATWFLTRYYAEAEALVDAPKAPVPTEPATAVAPDQVATG